MKFWTFVSLQLASDNRSSDPEIPQPEVQQFITSPINSWPIGFPTIIPHNVLELNLVNYEPSVKQHNALSPMMKHPHSSLGSCANSSSIWLMLVTRISNSLLRICPNLPIFICADPPTSLTPLPLPSLIRP
jgi:hypothetical protein